MSKKLFSFFAIFALIIIMGAGCQNNTNENNNNKQIEDLSVMEDEDLAEENELILSVENLGNGKVRYIWNRSNNPEGYRMLHSARKNADNPFWQFVATNNDEGIFYNVPTGTRFFRVCELRNKKCVNYSNEVELEVK